MSRHSENPQNGGSIKELCGAPPCQLSCHVYVHRYSNISVSVSDHWEVNCNDPVQDCGLSHMASISPVHCCANCMFVSCFSLTWFFFLMFVLRVVHFADFELFHLKVWKWHSVVPLIVLSVLQKWKFKLGLNSNLCCYAWFNSWLKYISKSTRYSFQKYQIFHRYP